MEDDKFTISIIKLNSNPELKFIFPDESELVTNKTFITGISNWFDGETSIPQVSWIMSTNWTNTKEEALNQGEESIIYSESKKEVTLIYIQHDPDRSFRIFYDKSTGIINKLEVTQKEVHIIILRPGSIQDVNGFELGIFVILLPLLFYLVHKRRKSFIK